jgi:hypothetical protein
VRGIDPHTPTQYVGSTTGWLRTTTPLTPGAEVTLTFSIHDEGDGILDSAVVIDNLRWLQSSPSVPETVKCVVPPQ